MTSRSPSILEVTKEEFVSQLSPDIVEAVLSSLKVVYEVTIIYPSLLSTTRMSVDTEEECNMLVDKLFKVWKEVHPPGTNYKESFVKREDYAEHAYIYRDDNDHELGIRVRIRKCIVGR